MDKTIKINLAGVLFQIDEEAYHLLRDYLQAIERHFNYVPGGHETIDDIESRIAEIFRSQQNIAGVITRENVEAMIKIIGYPDDFDQPENKQDNTYSTSSGRRLYRNPDDSIISGVCGGIGAYMNMDPVWIRIIFIVFALFFGVGFFVYIAMWIALPSAFSDKQKKELYGKNYTYRVYSGGKSNNRGEDSISRVGGVFNEVFRAIGKFFYILFRIVLIIVGVAFVVTGFTLIVAFIMGFFFKYPGFISMGSLNTNLFYLPDLLNCVVNPTLTPWIIALTFIAIVFPLLAIVYWGIKMIFWFRAKDGVISLIFLVLWVMSIAALSIILFNEGVSFYETGRTSSQEIFMTPPDTLHIITSRKVKDLPVKKEFSLPDNHYAVFIGGSDNTLAIRARLRLVISNHNAAKVEITKRSSGRTRAEAARKAESLIYNYKIINDTLFLDEYFTLPTVSKWSADELNVNLYLPEKTVLHFGNGSENMVNDRVAISKDGEEMETYSWSDLDIEPWKLGNKYWIVTGNGLKEVERAKTKRK